MNKLRRRDLARVTEYLQAANQPLTDALEDLGQIRDEESEAYEATQESFPDGAAAEAMAAAVSSLEEAIAAVEEMTSAFDEAIAAIEAASE